MLKYLFCGLMNYNLLLLQSDHGHHGFLVNAHYVTPMAHVWSLLTVEDTRDTWSVFAMTVRQPVSGISIDSILANE